MALIYRLSEGDLEFLVFSYEIRGRKSLRSVTGTQEHPGDSPQKTIVDEMGEELFGKKPFQHAFDRDPVVYTLLKSDENNETGFHAMIGFLTRIERGEFRSDVYVDDTGDEVEIHGVPQWIEAGALLEIMESDPNTKFVHLDAIRHAVHRMASTHRDLGFRYGALLSDFSPRPIPPLVEEYLARFPV